MSSLHKLQKFTSSGELIKCVGQRGSKEREFDDPRGVTLYNNRVYLCDRKNDRIQVFDLDLKLTQSISSRGKGKCEFYEPLDVKFDSAGNMYIVECRKERVQVMDVNGRIIQVFGQEGKGKLRGASALHIVDKYVYVSDFNSDCIVVYDTTSGQFVSTFGKLSHKEGRFDHPYCITSCANGFIYVCDWNNRVHIFLNP